MNYVIEKRWPATIGTNSVVCSAGSLAEVLEQAVRHELFTMDYLKNAVMLAEEMRTVTDEKIERM